MLRFASHRPSVISHQLSAIPVVLQRQLAISDQRPAFSPEGSL